MAGSKTSADSPTGGIGTVTTTRDGLATTRHASSSMYGRAPAAGDFGGGRRSKASQLFELGDRTDRPGSLTAWCIACGAFFFIVFALSWIAVDYLRPRMRMGENLTVASGAGNADEIRHVLRSKPALTERSASRRRRTNASLSAM
ncbi:hypothetical protein V5799_021556 [Amblyomma americanum]|uniref:Uncharacterized protein n=1 Tax=Amblyomma americanum TaxID=6943 RepID=A0AAQ4FN20_AMBAM